MIPVQGPVRHSSPHRVDDLARTRVIWEALCTPSDTLGTDHSRQEDEDRLESLADDPLAPAMGIVNGIRLSVVLWGVILLGVVLLR